MGSLNHYHDGCHPLLELGEAYRRGLIHYERVRNGIKGRVACHRETCGVIAEVVSRCGGAHVEIGVLFGGTTIVTGLSKPKGMIYAVDPLGGYYGMKVDTTSGLTPSKDILIENLHTFGLSGRVEICTELSYPWPLPTDLRFDSALVDGDHSYEGTLADWCSLKHRTERYVIFDNVDSKHPGVVKAFKEACSDPDWQPALLYDICGVVERVAK